MASIVKLKNSLKGQDIWILGNAPSLKDEDLTLLKGKHSIGINGSPLICEQYAVESDYYVVTDVRFITQNDKSKIAEKVIQEEGVVKVFRDLLSPYVSKDAKNMYYVKSLGRDGISLNLSKGFYFGSTTVMLAIQLAFYMGCKNIYLLGVDFNYIILEEKGEDIRFYKEDKAQEFDSLLSVQLKNIADSYNVLQKYGVNLYLCSKQSLLRPYIPYVSFKNSINKKMYEME